jgi:23S rRNA maturation mini-RNase III
MSKITWLELYKFLQKKENAHNIPWDTDIKIYDATTGVESDCDIFYLKDNTNENLVLMTHIEEGRNN